MSFLVLGGRSDVFFAFVLMLCMCCTNLILLSKVATYVGGVGAWDRLTVQPEGRL